MNDRARALIASLALEPHPEGGWYRQVFKSQERVTRQRDDADRSALTTIYFLLIAGTYSAWHRVQSDEVWHWYEGEPLELLMRESGERGAEGGEDRRDGARFSALRPPPSAQSVVLGPDRRVHVVPARAWQAARPLGAYALVGCTVGPGFEFDDFELTPGPI